MKTKTAIVILNWNGVAMLQRFLPLVLEHSAEAEVIVADNASTDQSVAMMREHFPQVRLVLLDSNYGFAEGYNLALKQVEADYYLLLNSDVEVGEGWLTPIVDFLDTHPDYCACQPKLRAWHRRSHYEYAGASGGYLDKYGYPFCRGRVLTLLRPTMDNMIRWQMCCGPRVHVCLFVVPTIGRRADWMRASLRIAKK